MINATENPLFQQFMKLVDKFRKMGVRTNADNPADAQKAIDFGAEGIGLFRIEHMFYGENSEVPLEKLRNMILADTLDARKAALAELEPYVRESAKGTLKVMDGKPLTFRLMDPPLHEFVPQTEEKQREVAKARGLDFEKLHARIDEEVTLGQLQDGLFVEFAPVECIGADAHHSIGHVVVSHRGLEICRNKVAVACSAL